MGEPGIGSSGSISRAQSSNGKNRSKRASRKQYLQNSDSKGQMMIIGSSNAVGLMAAEHQTPIAVSYGN